MTDHTDKERSSLIRSIRARVEMEKGFGMSDLPLFRKLETPKARKEEVVPQAAVPRAAAPQSTAPDREQAETLRDVEAEAMACTKCPLHDTRTKVVFGVGNPDADLMFVGEAPGHDEDVQGEPFVGRAGQLLTKIIEAMGMKRSDVYIANILKCRPPNNRAPVPSEMAACIHFLRRQIRLIRPKILCALGSIAVQGLLKSPERIGALRGKFQEYEGIRLMPTFHPAYLLRNPEEKRKVWEDMKLVRDTLKEMPEKK